MQLNETHDVALTSWVESANAPGCDFPVQNLPFCSFRKRGSGESYRVGVAIGDQIVDIRASLAAGSFNGKAAEAARAAADAQLNRLMELGHAAWSALRLELSRSLRHDARHATRHAIVLAAQGDAEYGLPVKIGNFTDFYSSLHHAHACGMRFRPDTPLFPNYRWMPVAYHSRASSIRISGQALRRPQGQSRTAGSDIPAFGPTQKLDFELELGVYVGAGSELGTPIPVDEAEHHLFGVSLLNDWSARDLQQWEATPIGPFASKNWGCSVSPWVVTLEALEPYRLPWSRTAQDPAPLPYLNGTAHASRAHLDIDLEVHLHTAKMRKDGDPPSRLTASNSRHLYWSVFQMLAHHTSSGCDFAPGDFYGTGTLSGPQPEQAGSLLELSFNGKKEVKLANGERRAFVADDDVIIIRGAADKPGAARIGFGTCEAQILPALPFPLPSAELTPPTDRDATGRGRTQNA
ncbi:fumarylacetoacetase [Paraburkholderia xenovorans LB400]|uniref:fumarylacetoacetase n=1 Tax=Paraburkholderia xenovorans (strain LB400) TaxID=266265 RepID=Q13GC1_PARXL|nr:fumarylacetoacetase [Paraburkholderia xenovorans]ABE36868.1 fumarylacetoacetate hydrolase [Paraburkholderia xenovorans LB400]AIP33960.1 fumarylacetoacetase [Paraburkholderia xenovorans LB400]